MKIVQVAESLSVGDAVANDVVAIDGILKKMRLCGGIFVTNANNINKKYLHSIAETIHELPALDEDDILIFHHAIANNFCYEIPKLKCRKILIYHNITPPYFFEGLDRGLQKATELGLCQVKDLNRSFDCCIVPSEFNKQDLTDMGYVCPIHVCPILIPYDEYKHTPTCKIIDQYTDNWINILFVGRLCPNKKQEDIIHTFAIYKKYYNPKSRLILVGSDGVQGYGQALRAYVDNLGIGDVVFTGSVSFPDILAYYSVAHVFVCMSEHEGFCVPLVEAMYFHVPIIAYSCCAIPDTLSGSGILLKTKDFVQTAGWIHQIVSNVRLQQAIVEKQNQRLEELSYKVVSHSMENILWEFEYKFKNSTQKITTAADLEEVLPTGCGSFVVVMPIKASDWSIAQRVIPFIKKNIDPKNIILISSESLKEKLSEDCDLIFINENSLIPGLTLPRVREVIERAGGQPKVAGWFLQQFIKLAFSMVCKDDFYLTWDADTIPLNKIEFFDSYTGKPYFTVKREYVEAYFDTIKRLLGLNKFCVESFISEHMLFSTALCREFIEFIESNSDSVGKKFWEKCIYACNFSRWEQPFSEFESYGTYVSYKHSGAYQLRKMRTLRCGLDFLGDTPSEAELTWAAHDFDTISFEHWSEPIWQSLKMCRNDFIRRHFPFKSIVLHIIRLVKLQATFGNNRKKELYQKMLLKMEFDYFFGDRTVFEIKGKHLTVEDSMDKG